MSVDLLRNLQSETMTFKSDPLVFITQSSIAMTSDKLRGSVKNTFQFSLLTSEHDLLV